MSGSVPDVWDNATVQTGPMARLVVRTTPDPVEGLWGWALRSAELNGYAGPDPILKMAGFLPPEPWSRHATLAKLAAMIDGPISLFAKIVPEKRGKGYRQSTLPGIDLPPWMIETRHTKICPQCLRERALIPAVWDLAIWTCCPHHQCRMVRNCPVCQSPLTWRRRGVNRCVDANCEGRLSSAKPEPAPLKEWDLVLLVAESLGVQGLPKRSSLSQIFGDLEGADIIRMIGGLGLAAAGRAAGRSKGGRAPVATEVAEFAAEILSDWPHGFHSFLTEVADEKNGTLSLKRRFGWVYQRLLGQGDRALLMPEAARAIVLPEFIVHIDESWIGEASVPRGLLGDDRPGRWVNREQAARRLGVHENTITKMVRDEQLSGHSVKEGARTILFIAADEVERLAITNKASLDRDAFKKKSDAMTFTVAARLAGVSVHHLRSLVKAGYVQTVARFRALYISRRSIENLIAEIERLVRTNDNDTADIINIARAIQVYKCLNIGTFLKSALDAKIAPVQIDMRERGLRRFYFKNAEVASLAHELDFEEGFTNREGARRMLQAGTLDVPRLIAAGLLTELSPAKRGISSRISLESIRRFNHQYASLPVIARAYITRSANLEAKLRALGVKPVLEANGENTRSYWECKDIEQIFGPITHNSSYAGLK